MCLFFFQAEDGIRDLVRSRGLGDVYKRQAIDGFHVVLLTPPHELVLIPVFNCAFPKSEEINRLSLIHI